MNYEIISHGAPDTYTNKANKVLHFYPHFSGSSRWSRQEPDLGKTAFGMGRFELSDFNFSVEKGYFYKELTVKEWEDPREIERLVAVAQAEVEHVMDKLISWLNIFEIVQRAKKDKKNDQESV